MRARPDRRREPAENRRESTLGDQTSTSPGAGRRAEKVEALMQQPGRTARGAQRVTGDAGQPAGQRVLAQRIVRVKPEQESVIPADAGERFVDELQTLLGVDRFDRYARGRLSTSFSPSQLRVTASSHALADLLRRRFMTELHAAAHRTLGRGISIHVDSSEVAAAPGSSGSADTQSPATTLAEPKLSTGLGSGRTQGAAADAARHARSGVIARHRLEDFLVGDSNRLAYNAALRLAEADTRGSAQGETDATAYSLLFVHGPCGVGKSHLAHGVAQRFRERHPGAVVRVTSGEAFMTEFVGAIRAGSGAGTSGLGAAGQAGIERFRANYRKVDLLCIDDVQALANKQATQAELLHTFEEIARGGARVVLVSDQHPRQLEKFSPQLISRFLAGMVAGIAPPDDDLTRRLIRTLAMRRGLAFDDTAVGAVAHRARLLPGAATGLSVREIEGILTRIEAVHRLIPDASGASRSGAINLLAIERALGPAPADHAPISGERSPSMGTGGAAGRPARIEFIIGQTCRYLSVDPADLSGRTRHKRVVLARALITHLARQFTTMSFPEIARALGRPNHSTVITAYQRLASQLAAGEQLGHEHVPEPMTVNVLVERLASVVKNAG